jgi:hypothetical protein
VRLQVAQLPRRRLQFGVYGVGSGEQELASVGQGDSPGAALDKRHASAAFQGSDLLGNRRGGVVQHFGRASKASTPRYLTKHREPLYIDHQFS